jgi:hypothetical protein
MCMIPRSLLHYIDDTIPHDPYDATEEIYQIPNGPLHEWKKEKRHDYVMK